MRRPCLTRSITVKPALAVMASLAVMAASMLLLAATPSAWAAPAAYGLGVSWNRNKAFVPGPASGSTRGNPNRDARGSDVYFYDAVRTDDDDYDDTNSLRDADGKPWYRMQRQPMQWNKSRNRWQQGEASISATGMMHPTRAAAQRFRDVPMFVWKNPAGDGVRVRVQGTYTLHWQVAWDIDLVLALYDVSDNKWVELSPTGRYARPRGDDELTLKPDPIERAMDAGDELVLSVRSSRIGDKYKSYYATLDDDVTITLVPPRANAAANASPAPPSPSARTARRIGVTAPSVALPAAAHASAPRSRMSPITRTIILLFVAAAINGPLAVLLLRTLRKAGAAKRLQ